MKIIYYNNNTFYLEFVIVELNGARARVLTSQVVAPGSEVVGGQQITGVAYAQLGKTAEQIIAI